MSSANSGRVLRKPLLSSGFLQTLLKELHKQDPSFKTIIFTKGWSKLRRDFLQGRAGVNDILVGKASPDAEESLKPEEKLAFLHLASQSGDVPQVYELLRLGATVNIENHLKETPLLLACHLLARLGMGIVHKHTTRSEDAVMTCRTRRIVRILIEQHANVNVVNVDGETPLVLLLQAERGVGELTRLLLAYGADPSLLTSAKDPLTRSLIPNIHIDLRRIPDRKIPPQPCPCWSGKLLNDCHNGPGLLSYPLESICPCCDSAKAFGNCCHGRKIEFIETWESKSQRLVRWKNPRGQILRPNLDGIPAERREKWKEIIELETERRRRGEFDIEQETMRLSVAKTIFSTLLESQGKMDPAFAFAMRNVDFDPQPWGRVLSRMESKVRQAEFNTEVDKYIALGKDPRSRIDIERAAKIGVNGGALFRRCEAQSCSELEGRDIDEVRVCSACKMTVYCGESCQKKAWKSHKTVCGSTNQREQSLPSQSSYMEWAKSTMGIRERADVSDSDLREKLRNHPEEFHAIPYKG